MKNNVLALLLFISCVSASFAQKEVTWKDLSHVEFKSKYVESEGGEVLIPEFSSAIKALEGKTISVTGYFLNLDATSQSYMLSKSPMAACFFCGGGGPETVIEIQFGKKDSFKTDDIVTITGVLELNQTDVNHLNYILKKAEGFSIN